MNAYDQSQCWFQAAVIPPFNRRKRGQAARTRSGGRRVRLPLTRGHARAVALLGGALSSSR